MHRHRIKPDHPNDYLRPPLDILDQASLVSRAMDSAGLGFSDLSAIAVTSGPGLVGSLIVGVMLAKAISYVAGKPIIAVNHLEAHALVARMVRDDLEFPFLVLIISGGHCQFLVVCVCGIGSLYIQCQASIGNLNLFSIIYIM
ncbi:putative endopeptidase [Anaplasma centrale str. Israel]|uniref:N(6)-L-threonylcarbamoyladenine synthase n=1 Tax=Anaplasma centrale (strain Israel) TaxID=574556 RepID=D1AUR9_ANACI|nr:putative endopeptidase [Anaplasma centrale str. Israel]